MADNSAPALLHPHAICILRHQELRFSSPLPPLIHSHSILLLLLFSLSGVSFPYDPFPPDFLSLPPPLFSAFFLFSVTTN